MLQVDGLAVRFGGIAALTDVGFTVETGSVLGLVGPNGAGKTTLFNAISGLVRPTAGSIRFEDKALGRLPVHARARLGIGRTFQIPQPLHELTVRQNLMVAQHFGAGRTDAAAIDRVLDLVNLTCKADAHAETDLALSEQKALEVGKALATEPKLLMLDEVLAGLETAGKRAFMTMLDRLRQELRLTMIVIEHDIETISRLCSHAVVLNFGRVIATGTPQAVFRDPEVRRSYTGSADA